MAKAASTKVSKRWQCEDDVGLQLSHVSRGSPHRQAWPKEGQGWKGEIEGQHQEDAVSSDGVFCWSVPHILIVGASLSFFVVF